MSEQIVTVYIPPEVEVDVSLPPVKEVTVVTATVGLDIMVAPVVVEIATSGAQGPPGGVVGIITKSAAQALSGHRAVYVNGAGSADYASASSVVSGVRVIGITTGAVSMGAVAAILPFGEITEPTWNWNPSLPVYLGVAGVLTQTTPTYPTAVVSVILGYPISSTTLLVNIGSAIALT